MENTGERLLTEEYNQNTIEHLHRYAFALQFVEDKIVIDIASGEGYGTHLLSSKARHITGIDIDIEAIEFAKKKYIKNNLKYIQGSANQIPIEKGTIDIVISFETIEHHNKHAEMISEIKRILKPNGILIISSPDKLHYSDLKNYKNEFHIKELYYEEFKMLIKSNFKNSVFLNQKMIYSSLLVNKESSKFYEFNGGFDEIKKHDGIEKPIYNIAIASQEMISNVFSSCFDGEQILNQFLKGFYSADYYKKNVEEILNSKTYKLGNFIIKPFRIIKKFFHA